MQQNLLLMVLMVFIPNPMFGQFCISETHQFNRGFIIGKNIYFGFANSFWKYSLELNRVLDNQFHSEDIFGKNNFLIVDGAVHFDVRDPCNEKRSKIFCQKLDKFSNLVLTFGQLNDRTYGYIAYRLKDTQTLERVTDGMPWNLKTKGLMAEKFWVDSDAEHYRYYGMTFDDFNYSDSLYASVPKKPNYGKLYTKTIDESGEFSPNWTLVKVEKPKTKFYGMFDLNGNLYCIGDSNDIYLLVRNVENKIIPNKLNVNELFNCFGNSTLTTQTSKTMQTSETLQTSQTNQFIETTEKTSTKTESETTSESLTINETTKKKTSSSSSEILCILMLVVVIVLVAIAVAAFLVFFFKLKSNKDQNKAQKTSAEKIDSEIEKQFANDKYDTNESISTESIRTVEET